MFYKLTFSVLKLMEFLKLNGNSMEFVIYLLPGVLFIDFSLTVKLYTSRHETPEQSDERCTRSFPFKRDYVIKTED